MQSPSITDHDYWFIIHDDKFMLLQQDGQYSLPLTIDIDVLKPYLTHIHSIGSFNSQNCYCAEYTSEENVPDNFELITLRKSLEVLGMQWYQATTKAYSVVTWDRNHHYCGRCAHLTEHHLGIFERICTHCGLAFYPRISPSVIVLIQRDDHLLMARSPHFMPGAYGLIAGFVEVGESLEQAVHREVQEEVAIKIKNLRYFGSQPWPFPDSLMAGFIADYESGEIKIDEREIEAAGWYRYDNLPGKPSSPVGIARKLVDYYIAQQEALHR